MEYEILLAEEENIEELIDLRIQFLKELKNVTEPDQEKFLEKNLREYLTPRIKDGTFIAYIIKGESKIISTCGMIFISKPPKGDNLTGKEAYIMNIYTVPEWRGRGYATIIMMKLIDSVKKLGIKKITLNSTEMGEELYKKIGFTFITGEMEYILEDKTIK